MKQTYRFLFAAIAMVAISFSASAQGSATANGNAAALIIAPITLTAGTTLHFGTAYNTGGTVIVSTAGVRSGTCAVSASAPLHSAGTFTVTGEPTLTYTTTLPAGTINITSGVNTMTVGTFNSNATGTIPAGGTETFSVGATLTVGVGQVTGAYTGTYPVTVQYN
jgi:Mat/Ecp fimbriae major subunit